MALEETVQQLQQQVKELRAEAGSQRVLSEYMYLCDTPFPLYEQSLEERVAAIGDCFTEDAIWEGVGGAHATQFGRMVGKAAIADHMRRFYGTNHANQTFNTHYVCVGQVWATADGAEGIWPQFQPWIYSDGTSLIRSSRVRVTFRETPDGWKISHYRTENLFIADLPSNWTKSQIEKAHLVKPGS